jgi:hypothetical protein
MQTGSTTYLVEIDVTLLEAGKRRLAGDTARAATTDEVKQLNWPIPTLNRS